MAGDEDAAGFVNTTWRQRGSGCSGPAGHRVCRGRLGRSRFRSGRCDVRASDLRASAAGRVPASPGEADNMSVPADTGFASRNDDVPFAFRSAGLPDSEPAGRLPPMPSSRKVSTVCSRLSTRTWSPVASGGRCARLNSFCRLQYRLQPTRIHRLPHSSPVRNATSSGIGRDSERSSVTSSIFGRRSDG